METLKVESPIKNEEDPFGYTSEKSCTDVTCIHFDLDSVLNSTLVYTRYVDFLTESLLLRNLDDSDTVKQQQQ
jgi:hypothetical protein